MQLSRLLTLLALSISLSSNYSAQADEATDKTPSSPAPAATEQSAQPAAQPPAGAEVSTQAKPTAAQEEVKKEEVKKAEEKPAKKETAAERRRRERAEKEKEEEEYRRRAKHEGGYYSSFIKGESDKTNLDINSGAGYYGFQNTKRELPKDIPAEKFLPTPIPAAKPEPVMPPHAPIPTKQGFADYVGDTGSITITRHFNQAESYAQTKNWDLAKKHYREAIRLKPDSLDFKIAYVKACLASNDWSEAASTLEKIIAMAPARQNEFLADYGIALFQLGDLDKANVILKKAAASGKNPEGVHRALLKMYLQQGRTDLAVNEYNAVFRYNPNDAALHSECAALLWRQEKLPQAIVHYRAAARIKPGDAAMQQALGYALLYNKDYAGAITAYRKAFAINPDPAIQSGLNYAIQQQKAHAAAAAPKDAD